MDVHVHCDIARSRSDAESRLYACAMSSRKVGVARTRTTKAIIAVLRRRFRLFIPLFGLWTESRGRRAESSRHEVDPQGKSPSIHPEASCR